jgi:nitroreductase
MQESTTLSTETVLDLIKSRWSPKVYSNRPVEREHLHTLFEAARWAASSMNEQPWHFIVVTKDDPDGFERMVDCLSEGNAVWARHAPVLILSVAKSRFEYKNRENRHAWHDVGLATQNLIIQAVAAGLFIHSMGGFSASRAAESFDIPEGYEPIALHSAGYLGDPSDTPEEIVDPDPAKRKRRPIEEFVFNGKWGISSDLISQTPSTGGE